MARKVASTRSEIIEAPAHVGPAARKLNVAALDQQKSTPAQWLWSRTTNCHACTEAPCRCARKPGGVSPCRREILSTRRPPNRAAFYLPMRHCTCARRSRASMFPEFAAGALRSNRLPFRRTFQCGLGKLRHLGGQASVAPIGQTGAPYWHRQSSYSDAAAGSAASVRRTQLLEKSPRKSKVTPAATRRMDTRGQIRTTACQYDT